VRTFRQIRALALVGWRLLTRGGFRGGTPKKSTGQVLGRSLLIALMVLWFGSIVFSLGDRVTHFKEGRGAASGVLLLGIAFFALFQTATIEAKTTGSTLGSGFIDALPFFPGASLAMRFGQSSFILVYAGAMFFGLAGESRGEAWPRLVFFSLEYTFLLVLLAVLLCTLVRALLPAHRARTTLRVISWTSVALFYLGFNPTLVAHAPKIAPVLEHRLRALIVLPTLKGLPFLWAAFDMAALAVVAYGLVRVLERRGIDPLGASPSRQKRSSSRLDAAGVERLLLRREQQTRFWWVLYTLGLGVIAYFAFSARSLFHEDVPPLVGNGWPYGLSFFIAYFGYLRAVTLAAAQAKRDLGARPFLASLPITPAATLLSKEPAIRLAVLPVLIWFVPPMFTSHLAPELLWRVGVLAALLAVLCSLGPAVAFLTGGVGAPGAMSTAMRFDWLLIALPFFATVAAPKPLAALPPLGAMALLTVEAHRAASRRVRWLDDAGDDLERETPVWRALLVFAIFMGLQSFTSLLLGFGKTSTAIVAGAAYLVSAIALVLLTRTGRVGLPPMRWIGARPWTIPLGLALGCATGLLGLGYSKLLERLELDVTFPQSPLEGATPQASAFFTAVIVLAAPLAEEMYFRGWLQPAIGSELPRRWKQLAFVLAAFAFAAVHPALSFPVIFALGLAAGWLYELSGGILAGICAHAAHNAVVTWLGR
jgi:membrane protease YdiL (CAAX protease family)